MKALRIKPFFIFLVCLILTGTMGSSQYYKGASKPAGGPGKESLVAWYSFNEEGSPSTWNDSSSNSNDITNTGIDPTTTAKIGGQAAESVRSNSDEGTCSTFPASTFHTSDFTIGGWIRLNSFPSTGAMHICACFGTPNSEKHWALRWTSFDDAWEFSMVDNVPSFIFAILADNTTTTTKWEFLTVVKNGDTVTMYVDSTAQIDTGSTSGATFNSGDTDLYVANQNSTATNHLDGIMDEWFFYTKALTQSEIDWLYNNGNGRSYNDL